MYNNIIVDLSSIQKLLEDGVMPTLVADKRNRCRSIMEIKSPNVSPRASDDERDDDLGNEGDESDNGEGETFPDEEQENDDAEQHQFSVI